jgi:hypothetical protein
MSVCLKARAVSRKVARRLVRSLLTEQWILSGCGYEGSSAERGKFEIVIEPRRLRVLDSVHVYFDECEVWLPLVSRLKVRSAMRLRIALAAEVGLEI